MSRDEQAHMSELYSAYAAGRLSPPFALMLETQAALRPDLSADLRCAEAIAGAMFEEETPDRLAPNAFEKALKAIDSITVDEDMAIAAAERAGSSVSELLSLPEPLRERALEACKQEGWRQLTGGVSRIDLHLAPDAHTHLYRIEPGSSVPRHSHRSDEYTLVVQGGFTDETGSYGPGDISRQTPGDTHQPIADEDEVCFALAVSEEGMRFTGLLGLIQKLARR